MARSQRIIALPLVLMAMACYNHGSKPPADLRVLGFASTCDGGVMARLVHFNNYDGEPTTLTIEEDALRADAPALAIDSHSGEDAKPFVIVVNGKIACKLGTTSPEPLIEGDCFESDDSAPRCKARLNLQGYRPAPPRNDRNDINVGMVYGEYMTLPPEELFDVQDFGEALRRHVVLHKESLEFNCDDQPASQQQASKASEPFS